MFFYSLDASHSEEQTASGVDSVNDESTDECWDSESAVSGSDTDSEYVPTPERPVTLKVSRTDLPNEVAFMEVYQQEKFVESINKIRRCITPHCVGELIPVKVKSSGLGGAISISYACSVCAVKSAVFESSVKYPLGNMSNISMSVQVAFILAGCTHATYYKTLRRALGIKAVNERVFMRTIELMYPVVKAMLDEVCEVAKQEMKEKGEEELGSWKHAVTTADGTWQTRGWHSKNATFTIRNYLNGALLYYHHLCQKGRDKVIQEELYLGTSKSAEGFAARVTFTRAREEGMQVDVHWQDADSSSSNAVSEVFPDAMIMRCGGHAGRAHKKQLEVRAKQKSFTNAFMARYEKQYPEVRTLTCHCRGNHKAGCGCLSVGFIGKAHTDFSSILMECQSQEEFARRISSLPNHARDVHEWDGGRCDFHPLRVCTCEECENKDAIKCVGKPYHTKVKLSCPFHALAYDIECKERASQADKLVHPILKRGHSNAVEASHNVLIRFRSKDIFLERLHYHLSTNLGLLQANLTYMQAKFGTSYHWIPELYRRLKLPVFDGVQDALEKYSVQRKRNLDREKTTPAKRRRIALKVQRTLEARERIKWSKKHGHDTYGCDSDSDSENELGAERKMKKWVKGRGRKCTSCGSSSHQRSSHSDCPFNKACSGAKRSTNSDPVLSDCDEAIAQSVVTSATLSDVCHSDEDIGSDLCTCGAEGRAHRRDCPMSSRKRYPGYAPFSRLDSAESCAVVTTKKTLRMRVGAYVCLHSRSLGKCHLPCRIVKVFGNRCQLYCSKGVLKNSYSATELMPLTGNDSIPLDKWRRAPKVSLQSIGSDLAVVKSCDCDVPLCPESILVPSASEDDDTGHDVWVNNLLYSLTHQDRKIIASHSGWLTDKVITAAQMLMLQYFPGMSGLQPPTLQEVCAFQVHTGEFVQIVNIRNKHWCVVSSVGCDSGVVNVYDSLYSSVSNKTIHLIASMVYSSSSTLEVRMLDVAKQSNSSDCGILSIAYAFDLCSGNDPCE